MGLCSRGWRTRSARGRSPLGTVAGSVEGSGARYLRGGRAAIALKACLASPGMASGGPAATREKLRFRDSSSLPMPRSGYAWRA